MSSVPTVSDRVARESAETSFDRNVVVVAGAGTGKTTLLVNRLVHLLMKEPRPVTVTEIVALTFTNKAATEMKIRLRERLAELAESAGRETNQQDGGVVTLHDLRTRYGLSQAEIARRAAAALADLEKAQIGTLHSFAAHLLRLHPIESAVDPSFQEDDGVRFEEHFTQCWELWIDRELSRRGEHHAAWRAWLRSSSLDEIRDLARALCSEIVDLEVIRRQAASSDLHPLLLEWFGDLEGKARVWLASYDRPKRRKIELMLAASSQVLAEVSEKGVIALDRIDAATRECLEKDVGNKVADWEEADFREAKRLIETVRRLLAVDHAFFRDLLEVLSPVAQTIRDSFAEKGWLSFDGLLARARRLLWAHPTVRERIKHTYRAVLVDEFQDTDPIQYEIILAVSEQPGRHAVHWQDMVLEPGKLFIVGDPKQSIYAFRRADIEAFDRVVEKIVSDHGRMETLTTNFRSDVAVLEPVNAVFDRMFVKRPLVQPANVRLEVRPSRHVSALEPGTELLVTVPAEGEGPFDAAAAARAEGEVLARWLKDEILPRPHHSAGQVALLFRKLTQADGYLDALRRHGIPYVIEGEKHFYRRQEVIDLVNLLRVIDHPHDRIALVGVLRSPLGGLTDRELYDWQEAGLLSYLAGSRLESFVHPKSEIVRRLFTQLACLHRDAPIVTLAEAVQMLFDRLPLLELAAASLHGEQAVANLLKVKHTAAALSDRAHLTLSGFVELMVRRLDEQPEEAESPLSEESSDAVQILTIHKAKGLEFPIVVLPGLHQGSGRGREDPPIVYDWSSGTYGLSLGERYTIGAVVVRAKSAVREEAERRRVLYVAMTRAKERLVLSAAMTGRSVGESALDWLQAISAGTVGEASSTHLTIGAGRIAHRVVAAPDRKRSRRPPANDRKGESFDPAAVAERWEARTARWRQFRTTRWRMTPTSIDRRSDRSPSSRQKAVEDQAVSRMAGIVTHRLLEQWDFRSAPDGLLDRIEETVQQVLAQDSISVQGAMVTAVREILDPFLRSELYARLASATILGQEVPFILPWGEGQAMEGVIDLLYRLDGRIWIADYKTDRVTEAEVRTRAATYAEQARIYADAVRRTLASQAVSFEFLFLRPAVRVEM